MHTITYTHTGRQKKMLVLQFFFPTTHVFALYVQHQHIYNTCQIMNRLPVCESAKAGDHSQPTSQVIVASIYVALETTKPTT